MIAVSLDGKMMNVSVFIPKSTPTLSGVAYFSRTREVTPSPLPPKSEGARTPIVTLKEVTLFWFELQSMFSESCEDSVKSLDVLVKSIRIHIDVVQIHKQFLKYVAIQEGLHKPLKGSRTIGQTHRHPVVLKDSKWCCKGGLGSVLLVHSNLIESA